MKFDKITGEKHQLALIKINVANENFDCFAEPIACYINKECMI